MTAPATLPPPVSTPRTMGPSPAPTRSATPPRPAPSPLAVRPRRSPLVSVVIPVYNCERFLAEAIRSVLAQTWRPLECLVVDDGSTDASADVARAFGADVRYLWKPNGGVSSARNEGVRHARGEYVAFLDADDLWLAGKLAVQMERFRSDARLGLVYSGVRVVDEDLTPIGLLEAPPPAESLRNTLLMELPVMAISMSGVVPRGVFRALGGFDEQLSTSADTDFACRLACEHPVAAVEDALALYRQHGAQMHRNPAAVERDMLRVLAKLFGGGRLPASVQRLRARAYANLHATLAVAHASGGHAGASLRHLLFALSEHPPRTLSMLGGVLARRVTRGPSEPRPRLPLRDPASGYRRLTVGE